MDFSDRHVVVTGGTGALGIAVVGALVEAGAVCHVPWHKEEEAEQFPYRGHRQVVLVGNTDLTDEAGVSRLFDSVDRLWGSIHLAGGFAMSPVAKTGKPALMQMVEMNLVTTFLCCAAAVRRMAGSKSGGRIVNEAARPGLERRTGAGMSAYTVAKNGVAALTAALAEEVAKDSILVNAVAPSIMDTPQNRDDMPKADFSLWPKVEEVAKTILFLASSDNKVTRGAIVPVYGKS
jgi:NAD(P)-dependent dehydrogenase (short-subunit alcohol dehydrogenase family)